MIASDYWGLIVFLFPLPIIVAWQIISLLRFHIKCNRVKTANIKEVFTTTVRDKHIVTRNGSVSEIVLITKAGKIPVSAEFYSSLPPNAVVEVSKAPELNIVLDHKLVEA